MRVKPDPAKIAAARRANIDSTRPTSLKGSGPVGYAAGDSVTVTTAVSLRYAGRTGVVVMVNTQRFATGSRYTEYGVTFGKLPLNWDAADGGLMVSWFRADELEAAS